MEKETIINTPEIKNIYEEYCRENKTKFSSNGFKGFLNFLETDFYDWVRENMKQFARQ